MANNIKPLRHFTDDYPPGILYGLDLHEHILYGKKKFPASPWRSRFFPVFTNG